MSEFKKLLKKLEKKGYLKSLGCYLEQKYDPCVTSLIIPAKYGSGRILVVDGFMGSVDNIRLSFLGYAIDEPGSKFTGTFLVKDAKKTYKILKKILNMKDEIKFFNFLNDLQNDALVEYRI